MTFVLVCLVGTWMAADLKSPKTSVRAAAGAVLAK
jgi:hypothetical protein